MNQPATNQELAELVGDLDMLTMSRIVATQASVDDVIEAIDGIENPEETAYLPTSDRVIEVREILFDATRAFDAETVELEARA